MDEYRDTGEAGESYKGDISHNTANSEERVIDAMISDGLKRQIEELHQKIRLFSELDSKRKIQIMELEQKLEKCNREKIDIEIKLEYELKRNRHLESSINRLSSENRLLSDKLDRLEQLFNREKEFHAVVDRLLGRMEESIRGGKAENAFQPRLKEIFEDSVKEAEVLKDINNRINLAQDYITRVETGIDDIYRLYNIYKDGLERVKDLILESSEFSSVEFIDFLIELKNLGKEISRDIASLEDIAGNIYKIEGFTDDIDTFIENILSDNYELKNRIAIYQERLESLTEEINYLKQRIDTIKRALF